VRFVLISLGDVGNPLLFIEEEPSFKHCGFSVRSGEPGGDSPEVHGPRGWIIGPGRVVDKGDEFPCAREGKGVSRLRTWPPPQGSKPGPAGAQSSCVRVLPPQGD